MYWELWFISDNGKVKRKEWELNEYLNEFKEEEIGCNVLWCVYGGGMTKYITDLDNRLLALYNVAGIEKKTDWDGVIDMLRRKVEECSKTHEKFQLEFSENPYGALCWGGNVMDDSARLYCIAHLITMMEHMVKGEYSMFRDKGFVLSKWIKEVATKNVVTRINSSSSNVSNEMERIKHNVWVEFAQGFLY